jgi:hypothetical protein
MTASRDGDHIATNSGSRVTPVGTPLARVEPHAATIADVVDHLLARSELRLLFLGLL